MEHKVRDCKLELVPISFQLIPGNHNPRCISHSCLTFKVVVMRPVIFLSYLISGVLTTPSWPPTGSGLLRLQSVPATPVTNGDQAGPSSGSSPTIQDLLQSFNTTLPGRMDELLQQISFIDGVSEALLRGDVDIIDVSIELTMEELVLLDATLTQSYPTTTMTGMKDKHIYKRYSVCEEPLENTSWWEYAWAATSLLTYVSTCFIINPA
jgi:hypothetical protein